MMSIACPWNCLYKVNNKFHIFLLLLQEIWSARNWKTLKGNIVLLFSWLAGTILTIKAEPMALLESLKGFDYYGVSWLFD